MGYSMSVACSHPKTRDRMKAFLDEHYRSIAALMAEAPERKEWERISTFTVEEGLGGWRDRTAHICVGDELAYGAAPSKLGFNFSSSGGAKGVWMWAFLGWVALKVGRKRKLAKLTALGVKTAVPYITYDDEPTPLLFESRAEIYGIEETARKRGFLVNVYGMNLHLWETAEAKTWRMWGREAVHEWITQEKAREALVREVIFRELQRLDHLWENSPGEGYRLLTWGEQLQVGDEAWTFTDPDCGSIGWLKIERVDSGMKMDAFHVAVRRSTT